MPSFERSGTSIYYEEQGSGFPLLLIAPGGMRSSIPFWQKTPYDPIEEFSPLFRVIALDQRNAGRSRAPIGQQDGWASYTSDHIALLDHLKVERCHVLGNCIGGALGLALMAAAPSRIVSGVLQQPIGLSPDNRQVFYELFDGWAKEIAPQHPEATEANLRAYRERMYGGDFVFSVSRDTVRALSQPLLVLMGNDIYHPSAVSREIVEIAPRARLIEHWKEPEVVPQTVRSVREFLQSTTPT
jgi:pimeloyl-ACP methyl ester carboxylesterase